MKSTAWLLVWGLLVLGACTPVGYVKPGVTDEEFAADSEACADIARRQAVRDQSTFRPRVAVSRSNRYDRRLRSTLGFGPSLSEIEFRYRRLCMLSKGYEIAPLEDEPDADAPEDGAGEEGAGAEELRNDPGGADSQASPEQSQDGD